MVANDNNSGNVVISGDKAAVDKAIEKAKELGARAIPLNVSAPFHCPLMQPAAERDGRGAGRGHHRQPARAAGGQRHRHARPTIPRRSAACWSSRSPGDVRWRESMIWMAGTGGVTRFAEAGAGKVLVGMAKRIAPDAEATPLNAPADLEAFAKLDSQRRPCST